MRSKPVFITIYLTLFYPAKNAVISSNFLVWKFLETVPFHKISTPGNQMKLRYFTQCGKKAMLIMIYFLDHHVIKAGRCLSIEKLTSKDLYLILSLKNKKNHLQLNILKSYVRAIMQTGLLYIFYLEWQLLAHI